MHVQFDDPFPSTIVLSQNDTYAGKHFLTDNRTANMTEGLYRKSETGVTSEPMKETGIYLPGSTGNAYVNALYMKDEVDTNIDQLTNDDENENYLDNKSEHAGEEQVDIGLKASTTTHSISYYSLYYNQTCSHADENLVLFAWASSEG